MIKPLSGEIEGARRQTGYFSEDREDNKQNTRCLYVPCFYKCQYCIVGIDQTQIPLGDIR